MPINGNRDGLVRLSKDMARDFGWERREAQRVARYVFENVLARVLDRGEWFNIPRFGAFDRRLVAHGKTVYNNHGEGGTTRPKYALRFKRSRLHTELWLEP